MASDELFGLMIPCSWEAKGRSPIVFPVERVTEVFKNRLQIRRRPYRAGAKVDTTGPDPISYDLDCLFHNGSEEEGVDFDALYPDGLNNLLDTLIAIGDTGTLTLPTRGPKRCKLDNYRRVEENARRDCAAVTFSFISDTEDGFAAASFSAPSAKSVSVRLAQECILACQSEGVWSDGLSSLLEAASALEALANAPGDFIDDLETTANVVAHTVASVENAFANAVGTVTSEIGTLLTSPESSRAGRALRKLSDTASGSVTAVTGLGVIATKTYKSEVSLFDVAADIGQDVSRLLPLNPGLANPLRIPPRTAIRYVKAA